MRIHILPVPEELRPASQPFRYPSHSADYGVEQDFFRYISRQKNLLVENPAEADWCYLPVYWTRWHLNHDYGKTGVDELRHALGNSQTRNDRTFTICQYDDGPLVDLGRATVFLSSRKSGEGIDIPLLSSPHRMPLWLPRKKYLASFIGRLSTHPARQRMAEVLKDRSDVKVVDGDQGRRAFVRMTTASLAVLAPRGYGGSSFRFFEAMQLGVVPILVGEYDTRPFKSFIDWDRCSFYVPDPDNLPALLGSLDRTDLLERGRMAARTYVSDIAYGKWCRFVVKEIERKS